MINIFSTSKSSKPYTLNPYIYSQLTVQERLSFDRNISTDLSKHSFETEKAI